MDEKDYGDLYDTDTVFLEKRKKEWQDFLRRWNSPEAVGRRGGTYFTPYGFRCYLSPSEEKLIEKLQNDNLSG